MKPLRSARNASRAMTATPALRGSRSVLSWLPPGPPRSMNEHETPEPHSAGTAPSGKIPRQLPEHKYLYLQQKPCCSRRGLQYEVTGYTCSYIADWSTCYIQHSWALRKCFRMPCDICALGCTLKPAAAEQVAGTSTVNSVLLCTSPYAATDSL